jgi:hypothetical protein
MREQALGIAICKGLLNGGVPGYGRSEGQSKLLLIFHFRGERIIERSQISFFCLVIHVVQAREKICKEAREQDDKQDQDRHN